MTTMLEITDPELDALGKMFAFTLLVMNHGDPEVAAELLAKCEDVFPALKSLAYKGLAAHRAHAATGPPPLWG